MIPVALCKELSSQNLISIVKLFAREDSLAKGISSDMYTPYEGARGISPSIKRKVTISVSRLPNSFEDYTI